MCAGMTAANILPTYQQVAREWATHRAGTQLFEKTWLDRMIRQAANREVLDLGCGSGVPIGRYLLKKRCSVTGVDGAEAMIELFRENLPQSKAIHADMRGLDLGRGFGAILAWNSFFHLSPDDQRAMFAVFARHAVKGTALMFTSGTEAGEAMGQAGGVPVYHSSLCPSEYDALHTEHGFEVSYFRPEDPNCGGHTIWLSRFIGTPA